MNGRAVVTGASGFIGRSLCQKLLERDLEVIGTTRSNSPPDLGIKWRQADITNEADVSNVLEGADYVFHLAGIGLMDGNAETVREVNVHGTKNVLSAVREGVCDRLVFTSTAGTRHTQGQEAAAESDLADPIGAYQESKRMAERMIQEFVDDGGDAVITHPTSVFGPGDERFTTKLLGLAHSNLPVYLPGGGSVVSVEDVASGLIAASEHGQAGEHYILGGDNLTFGEMLSIITEEMGTWAPPIRIPAFAIRVGGYGVGAVNRILGTNFFPVNAEMARLSTRYRFYDSQKAIDELGYSITPLSEHVPEAIKWYLNNE